MILINVCFRQRMDARWVLLSKLKDAGGNTRFRYLPVVMLAILSIPVAQAQAERQFSIAGKFK